MNEKIKPLEKDSAIAITLNKIAEEKAISIYSEFYKENRLKISSSECIINNRIFLKILNDCLILSQQKIEERSISTKFIIPNLKNGLINWPEGVKLIPIEEFSFPSIDLQNLKKYFEMGSDTNSYLVIDWLENSKEKNIFNLKGFMFVEKSINNFIFKYEQKKLSAKEVDSIKLLGCLYDSVIFSVNNGKVSVSYLDEPFLIIEKGLIFQNPYLEIETFLVSHFSRGFQEKLKNFIGKDLNDLPLGEIINIIFNEELDKLTENKLVIRILIDYKVGKSLRNIFLKISEARHGSTLIFNFKGDINNKELFQPNPIKLKIPYGSSLLKLTELKEPKSFHTEERQGIFNSIEMYENAIVSLSKTDGAMIFDQNLDLILVGAFLKTKSSVSSSGGARRKSAEGFVKDNKETMAIVISQDGTITYIPGFTIKKS